jgi:hypothetical protein
MGVEVESKASLGQTFLIPCAGQPLGLGHVDKQRWMFARTNHATLPHTYCLQPSCLWCSPGLVQDIHYAAFNLLPCIAQSR